MRKLTLVEVKTTYNTSQIQKRIPLGDVTRQHYKANSRWYKQLSPPCIEGKILVYRLKIIVYFVPVSTFGKGDK